MYEAILALFRALAALQLAVGGDHEAYKAAHKVALDAWSVAGKVGIEKAALLSKREKWAMDGYKAFTSFNQKLSVQLLDPAMEELRACRELHYSMLKAGVDAELYVLSMSRTGGR